MIYQSSAYSWLKIRTIDSPFPDTPVHVSAESLAKVLPRLNIKSEAKDMTVQDIRNLSPELTSWLHFAMMNKMDDSDTKSEQVIPVYDFEYFKRFPLPEVSEIKSEKEIYWTDLTDLDPEKLPLDFVSFDTETTGTDIKSDKIIQLSAAKYRSGKLVDKFDVLVNPRRQLLPKITEITGITTDQVMKAKDFIDVAPDFLKFIKGETLVGQNIIEFDLPLVLRECSDNKLNFGQYNIIDTLPLSHKAFPGRKHYAQEKLDRDLHLSERVQEKGYVDKNVLHNSLNDSYTTAELYLIDRDALIKDEKKDN